MEGRAFWKKQGRTWPLVLAAVLSVVFLSAAAYLLLFGYNHFSLELELQDGEQLTLEYGEHYREPGCRVLLRGSKFWQTGLELRATAQVSGSVNEQKLGKYVLDYRAECFGLEAETTRIVRVVDTVCPEILLVPDGADLKPEPEYLGEAIPVSGNGDITNDA